MATLEADGLRKHFNGLVAVDGVSFAVSEGTVFGFLGPIGAGTTTTINIEKAERLCDRIAFILKGRIVRVDDVAALLKPIQEPYLIAFTAGGFNRAARYNRNR